MGRTAQIAFQGEVCLLHKGGDIDRGFSVTFLLHPGFGKTHPFARFKPGHGTGQLFEMVLAATGEEGELVPATGKHPARASQKKGDSKGPYRHQAKALRKSGFFSHPVVWFAIGTDKQFLEWVRTAPCISCNAPGPSEAAHVRRVANGSGTGIKPEFSAIPLCKKCHFDQHNYGESSLGGKEQVDKWRSRMVQSWGWVRLRAVLGFDSWTLVPPQVLRDWAVENGVLSYLPPVYRQAL